MSTVPHAPEAELEAVLRLASARDVLDHMLLGDPTWLRADVVDELANLVRAGARWLRVAA
jgi:hypothetical protein